MLDNEYIKKYKENMTSMMMNINPNWDKEFINRTLDKMINDQLQNPKVNLDNNFTGENRDTTLLSVLDWTFKRKPIIAGNGTFYKNQHEAINPIAKMLEGFLSQRKAYKKKMFAVEDNTSQKYKDLDRRQQNEKINCNSYYGASGAPSSAFYSLWSGPATTLTAQSVISTTETLFEGFIADNYLFLHLTECMEWCERNLKEFKKSNDIFDDFIQKVSTNDLVDRLSEKIIDKNDTDEDILYSYIDGLMDDEKSLLFYKNNLIQFIEDHDYIQDIIISIFDKVENLDHVNDKDENWIRSIPSDYFDQFVGKTAKDWNSFVNKQYFMDPNNAPETIANELFILNGYLMKYVYCRYLSVDRVYRLKNFKRSTVTVIDTDSNILSLDTVINYLFDHVIKGRDFGRSYENNIYIAVNILAYSLTSAVTDILLTYGKYSNVPEEYRPIYNMKNEFLRSFRGLNSFSFYIGGKYERAIFAF